MTTNIGATDRVIRIVLGLILLSLLFILDGGIRWIGLIGIIPLFTAAIRWCPSYSIIGTDTCGSKTDAGE